MKIIVATHKDKIYAENNIIQGIQVGASKAGYVIDQNYLLDDKGDNISSKNSNYNELTALYWMWKNLPNEDVLGLIHYRRYLDFFVKSFFAKPKPTIAVDSNAKLIDMIRNGENKIEKRVQKWLNSYDIITPFELKIVGEHGRMSIRDHYYLCHKKEDWDVTMDIIRDKYPAYGITISDYLDKSHLLYYANIFIAKREFVNNYCTWLFSIFDELEKQIVISDDTYQRRVFGFLAERLFTLYIVHNKLKVKPLPVIMINEMFVNGPTGLNK